MTTSVAQMPVDSVKSRTIVAIETPKKTFAGYLVVFRLTKDKTFYSGILVNKAALKNVKSVGLKLNQTKKSKSDNAFFVLNIPSNSEYVIQNNENEFAIIPYFKIDAILKEKGIDATSVFVEEENFSEFKIPVGKRAIEKLKTM
jgi:hypothetical protein